MVTLMMKNMKIKPNYIDFLKLRIFWRTPEITILEKCVIMDLFLYAGVNGQAFPGEIQIGNDLNRSDKQIRTIINKFDSEESRLGPRLILIHTKLIRSQIYGGQS
jgi:hypothetical protein